MASAAARPLTAFEQVLLGLIASQPRSGYGLRKLLADSPASTYAPSPGALYPALRRLAARGLLASRTEPSAGLRAQHVYSVTPAGHAAFLHWLREPVRPATVGADMGLHLMRFALMEGELGDGEVAAFLADLEAALAALVAATEDYLASGAETGRAHAQLALRHGVASARSSLAWTRAARAALAGPEVS